MYINIDRIFNVLTNGGAEQNIQFHVYMVARGDTV